MTLICIARVILMRRFTGIVVGLAGLACAATAWAANPVAQVGDVQGKVMINVGEGFVPLANSAGLVPGNTVFVGPKSSATLTYLNPGCSVELKEGTVVTIGEKATCKVGSALASPVADAPMPEVFSPLPLLVGGLAVAGLVGIIIATNDEEPVSP